MEINKLISSDDLQTTIEVLLKVSETVYKEEGLLFRNNTSIMLDDARVTLERLRDPSKFRLPGHCSYD